jgi:hypothetical protein
MKPFKWIKNHPFESAAIAAALVATGGTAAGWFGPAAAAGEAAAGAGAAGAAAGDAFMPGLLAGTNGLGGEASALLGAFGGVGQAAGVAGGTLGSEWGGMSAADAAGTGIGQVGGAGGSGLASGWKMDPKQAMLLAQMAGGGQQPQLPMGAPMDYGNPMQRQAMMTQEQITKKWLLQNDPNTYARIYGAPQPMGA